MPFGLLAEFFDLNRSFLEDFSHRGNFVFLALLYLLGRGVPTQQIERGQSQRQQQQQRQLQRQPRQQTRRRVWKRPFYIDSLNAVSRVFDHGARHRISIAVVRVHQGSNFQGGRDTRFKPQAFVDFNRGRQFRRPPRQRRRHEGNHADGQRCHAHDCQAARAIRNPRAQVENPIQQHQQDKRPQHRKDAHTQGAQAHLDLQPPYNNSEFPANLNHVASRTCVGLPRYPSPIWAQRPRNGHCLQFGSDSVQYFRACSCVCQYAEDISGGVSSSSSSRCMAPGVASSAATPVR